MNNNDFKRKEAIRLFPFFPLEKRSELHNYLVKIPEYDKFNNDNREMSSVLFKDTTKKNLNTIIHGFIINGIKQDILPKIYNAIYDGMHELEPYINDMVVTDTTVELIQPPLADAVESEGSKNGLPLAIQVAKPAGGKGTKNKKIKGIKSKSKRNKSKKIKGKGKSKRNKHIKKGKRK